METSQPNHRLKYVLRAGKSNICRQSYLKYRLQRNIRASEKFVIQNKKAGILHINGGFQPRLFWIEIITQQDSEHLQWNWIFFIRSYLCMLSQRISYLWNLRESTVSTLPSYTAVKFLEAASLYYDVLHISGMCKRISDLLDLEKATEAKLSFSCTRLLHYFLQCTTETIIPRLLARVDNYISHCVHMQTMASLASYLTMHPHSFLALSQNKSSTGTCAALRTLLHTVYACTTFHTYRVQQHKQAHAEQDIFTILKESAVESVLRSFLHIQPSVKPLQFTSTAINTSLSALLQILIEKKELFDELGVYKLYRIVLKLQEYIYEIKKEWEMPEGEQLVDHSRTGTGSSGTSSNIWQKTEIILQILNCAVFSRTTRATTTASNARNNSYSKTPAVENTDYVDLNPQTIVGVITAEERESWKKLAVSPKQSLLGGCYQPIRRHKGTVFVALELNLQNM